MRWLPALAIGALLAAACEDEPVSPVDASVSMPTDGPSDAACPNLLYTTAGCNGDVRPALVTGCDAAAVAVPYCGCDGRTIFGNRNGAAEPFRAQGACAADAAGDAP